MKLPGWKVAVYLVLEVVVLCLVIAFAVWGWNRSPVFRYHLLGNETSMRDVLLTLRRGDSIDKVRELMGDKYLDLDSEYSIRCGLQQLVATHPDIFLQGYAESDAVLVYSTRFRRYGLQFRDGRLVGSCSQTGLRIQPPAASESDSTPNQESPGTEKHAPVAE